MNKELINFSNSDNHPLQLPLKSVKETIYDLIKKNFKKENNLSLKDKELVSIVLRSYHKSFKKIKLEDSEFILAKHEISEFFSLEPKNILRYVIYRYKYNQYPKLKILADYPPNIQIEPTSQCN